MMDEFCFSQASEEVMELATSFVDKYVDYIENLPFYLQRNVTRLREIDCNCREILTEIEDLYRSFTKETDINLKKRATLIRIQRLFGRCQELGDEKISIVQQMSEAIESKKKVVEHASYRFTSVYKPDQKNDFNGKREQHKSYYNKPSKRSRRHRHICHEKEKALLTENSSTTAHITPTNNSNNLRSSGGNGHSGGEKQILNLAITNPNKPQENPPKIKEEFTGSVKKSEKCDKKKQSPASNSSNGNTSSSSAATPSSSQKTPLQSKPSTSKAPVTSSKTSVVTTTTNNTSNKNANKTKKKKKKLLKHRDDRASTRSPSPQVDIPIDPDEPTYCICDQVSFGQMIGCDNKKCPLEWFHFSCVGLTHKPKGKWYCPDCTRDKKKDSKRDHR